MSFSTHSSTLSLRDQVKADEGEGKDGGQWSMGVIVIVQQTVTGRGQISGEGEGRNEVENPHEEEKKARQRDLREGKIGGMGRGRPQTCRDLQRLSEIVSSCHARKGLNGKKHDLGGQIFSGARNP